MTDNLRIQREIEKTEMLIHCARDLREKFQDDPHRPRYHFLPPSGWMNDINGPLFWNGRYHIFYQCNPDGEAYWKNISWGHASSLDLVHWVHHPLALVPTPGGPDRDGCFSGGMVVNNGVPTIIYHGVPEGTCLATSSDDELLHWAKHPANPVIRVPQPGDPNHGRYIVYDPCAWRHRDSWFALCGGRDPQKGDTAYLFKSSDLIHWDFLHPFYESDRRWTHVDEDCAVPDFFPLGGIHILSFSSHLLGAQYYLGRYEADRFHPERHGRFSWLIGAPNAGAITMLDARNRRLFFTWILEARSREVSRAAGWAGAMNLPRVLSLAEDGSLGIEPAPEIEILRFNHRATKPLSLSADSEVVLDGIRGDCLELALEFDPGDAREFGVKVRCSPDGAEQTAIICRPASKTLTVDVSKSSLSPEVSYPRYFVRQRLKSAPDPEQVEGTKEPPFGLKPGELLRLRVFLDRSVVEVFANGRQAVAQRIYPSRSDSQAVTVFSRGGRASVRSVEAWDLAGTNS